MVHSPRTYAPCGGLDDAGSGNRRSCARRCGTRPMVTPDETGWRVGAVRHGPRTDCGAVPRGRGVANSGTSSVCESAAHVYIQIEILVGTIQSTGRPDRRAGGQPHGIPVRRRSPGGSGPGGPVSEAFRLPAPNQAADASHCRFTTRRGSTCRPASKCLTRRPRARPAGGCPWQPAASIDLPARQRLYPSENADCTYTCAALSHTLN